MKKAFLQKNISIKTMLAITATYAFVVSFVIVIQAWMIGGLSSRQALVDEFGHLQSVAYEKAVSYCNNTSSAEGCKKLLIQSVTLYNNEGNDGVNFLFSDARHSEQAELAIYVEVDKSGTIRRVEYADKSALDSIPLP